MATIELRELLYVMEVAVAKLTWARPPNSRNCDPHVGAPAVVKVPTKTILHGQTNLQKPASLLSHKNPSASTQELKEAVDALDSQDAEVSAAAYANLLHACGNMNRLAEGRKVHACIARNGLEEDIYVGNYIVQMYSKCGSIKDARRLFDMLRHRNAISWNNVIAAYAQKGHWEEVFQLLEQMGSDYVKPSRMTYVGILNACAGPEALTNGRCIHASISESGFEFDVVVGPALVSMYTRCGNIEQAQMVFKAICERNVTSWDVVSWNVVITAYAQNGYCTEAFQVFHRMQLEGVMPNEVTLVNVLTACAEVEAGERIHARILAQGYDNDNNIVRNALVTMYAKFEKLVEARRIFDGSCSQDVVSWNAMIAAYIQYGHGNEALQLFRQMQLEGVRLDRITFISILSACDGPEFLAEGRLIYAYVLQSCSNLDVVVSTALLNMFGKCRSLETARVMFDSMQHRNVVSWNSMISAYAQHGHWEDAVQLFRLMQLEGTSASHGTFISILNGFASQGRALAEGKFIHACIAEAGFESGLVMGNALVNMYGNCKSLVDARRIFDKMPRCDVITWTSMLSICVQHEHWNEAGQLFRRMQLDGSSPNEITFATALNACNSSETISEGRKIHASITEGGFESEGIVGASIVSMYSKSGYLEEARNAFDKVPERGVALCNAMISAYADHGCHKEALEIYRLMLQEAVTPNKSTLVALLDECAHSVSLSDGKSLHAYAAESGHELDVVVGTALVNMYGKCGNVEAAVKVFSKIERRDTITWNALIAAYAQHGHGHEALYRFQLMQLDGINPDATTFVGVLSACSHSCLMDQGRAYFLLMVDEYRIAPTVKHYGCTIDLLARRGLLSKAEELLNSMPFEPNDSEWMALLSACKIHVDVERGHRAADHVLELDPRNKAACVMLSSIYAAAGK